MPGKIGEIWGRPRRGRAGAAAPLPGGRGAQPRLHVPIPVPIPVPVPVAVPLPAVPQCRRLTAAAAPPGRRGRCAAARHKMAAGCLWRRLWQVGACGGAGAPRRPPGLRSLIFPLPGDEGQARGRVSAAAVRAGGSGGLRCSPAAAGCSAGRGWRRLGLGVAHRARVRREAPGRGAAGGKAGRLAGFTRWGKYSARSFPLGSRSPKCSRCMCCLHLPASRLHPVLLASGSLPQITGLFATERGR